MAKRTTPSADEQPKEDTTAQTTATESATEQTVTEQATETVTSEQPAEETASESGETADAGNDPQAKTGSDDTQPEQTVTDSTQTVADTEESVTESQETVTDSPESEAEAAGPIDLSEQKPAAYSKVLAYLADGSKVPARTYKWDARPDEVGFESLDGKTQYTNVIAWEPLYEEID